MTELKPCPFCVGEAFTRRTVVDGYGVFNVTCKYCGADVRAPEMWKDYCVDLWNTRTAPELNKPLTLEELLEMDGMPVWIVEGDQAAWGVLSLAGNCFEKEPVITMADGNFYLLREYNNETWLAYRTKPKRSGQ